MARADKKGSRGKAKPPAKPRPDLPAKESIVSVKTFTSPKGRTYRAIETTERDPYDPPDPRKKQDD
jgi:hypothetical protein